MLVTLGEWRVLLTGVPHGLVGVVLLAGQVGVLLNEPLHVGVEFGAVTAPSHIGPVIAAVDKMLLGIVPNIAGAVTYFLGKAGLNSRHVGKGGAGAAGALTLDWSDD